MPDFAHKEGAASRRPVAGTRGRPMLADMNRREAFLVASSSLASTALAHTFGTAVSGCGAQSSPTQHGGTTPPATAHEDLARLVAECLAACEACHAHCLSLLATGDTSMARCSQTTHVCAALCRAMVTVANTESSHLAALAAVCAATCGDCHEACSQHAGHHAICARCADACQRCGDACRAISA
jgi:Cys-rich four helix bundle protein (predicted Tat secretion target)